MVEVPQTDVDMPEITPASEIITVAEVHPEPRTRRDPSICQLADDDMIVATPQIPKGRGAKQKPGIPDDVIMADAQQMPLVSVTETTEELAQIPRPPLIEIQQGEVQRRDDVIADLPARPIGREEEEEDEVIIFEVFF